MKNKKLIWSFALMVFLVLPLALADNDPNRIMGYARIDGSIAPAGTLINITAGGATVQVTVDDGINVVPAEFGQGKFETDADVPYWDTGDAYLVQHSSSLYSGQLTGYLIAGTTDVGTLDLFTGIAAPTIYAQLHPDGQSVALNWTNISLANSYTLYYSSNLTEMEDLNIGATLPAGVTSITGIATNQYNDSTANQTKKRYYRVAAVRSPAKNLSSNAVGKYTHTLIASSDGTLGRNLVAEPINASLNAKTYLEAIPANLNPSISKLDRSDPEDENWVSQVVGLPASLFGLKQPEGYMAFVNLTYNYTFVGPVWTQNITHDLIASSDGVLGRNLVGVTYTRIGYTAKTYLNGLPAAYNPSISHLDRSDPEDENWVSQVVGLPASLFDIIEGEGYMAFVNTSYNYSLK